jgi:hypothetical protein
MYSFELNIGSLNNPVKGGGYIEVNPLTTDNGIVRKREDDNMFMVRKSLKQNLTFKELEFIALKTLRDNNEKNIELKIYYRGYLRYYGYLIFEGDWDEDRNICSLITQTIDQYSDLEKNKDYQADITSGIQETVYITQDSKRYRIILPCFNGQWTAAKLYYDPDGNISEDPTSTHPDWAFFTLVDSTYTGSCNIFTLDTYYVTVETSGWTQSVLWSERYLKKQSSVETIRTPLTRAIKLFSILERLLLRMDSTININESTYSDYINDVNNKIYNLYIMDKSDAKRPESSNPARFQYIKFSDMMDMYNKFFNLFYKVDENLDFSLVYNEGFTEADYNNFPANDLTTYKDINITVNQRRYSSRVDNKTSKETLRHEVAGAVIDYELYFNNEQTYDFQDYNNDISYLITDPEEVNDDGFCLLACNAGRNIINETFGGVEFPNQSMFPFGLMNAHYLNANRPFSSGKLENIPVTLIKEKDKELILSNVPVSDDEEVSFDYFIKTDAGLGIPYEIYVPFEEDFSTLNIRL